MPSHILVGNESDSDIYIKKYKEENSIADEDTTIYMEKILIEHARGLIKSLSFKSSRSKLYIIKNELTIEAQNALLKNIEELESYNTLIFCTSSIDSLLPTVRSRCFIVRFNNASGSNDKIYRFIEEYLNGKVGLYELIDRINEEKNEQTIFAVQSCLRQLFLNPDIMEKRKVYDFSKKILRLSSLIEKNNINFQVALEKVFAY